MSANVYAMAPLSVTPSGGSATVIPIEDIGLPKSILNKMFMHSGNEYASAAVTPGANLGLTFKTPFDVAYSLIGLSAIVCTGLDVYLSKFVNLVRSSGSVHPKMSLAASCTAYMQITGWAVDEDGILMADVEAFYLSNDGATFPMAAPTTASLPTLASQPQLRTMGPLSVNGTVISGAQSHGVELGQRYELRRNDGDRFPRVCVRKGATPKMVGGHEDPVTLESILGYTGSAITSNVVQYYKGYSLTDGTVQQGAATALSVTIANGRINPVSLSASTEQLARESYEVWGTSATATNPLAVNLADTAPAEP